MKVLESSPIESPASEVPVVEPAAVLLPKRTAALGESAAVASTESTTRESSAPTLTACTGRGCHTKEQKER